MIFAGASFWGAGPDVEAVLVRGGRIVAVGPLAELRTQAPGEPEHDLGGGFAIPGLTDAHGHLGMLGESAEQLDLRDATSAEDVARRVEAAPRRRGWVRGRAWSDARWPAPPSADALTSASRGDHVLIERSDSHAVWVSASVLALAGIGRETVDPPGGRIERGPDGRPTGVLVDRAIELVERLIPEPTEAELDARLLLAAQRCARAGLTSVHDAGLDASLWRALQRLEARGVLPVRVYGMERDGDPQADAVLAEGPQRTGRLELRAVKFFVDGALGSRGAAFFEPYADGQGGTGLLLEAREHLAQRLARRMRQGLQVALHAIGDRANAVALEAIGDALALSGATDARPRIEHAQHLRAVDVPRFRALGVIASMQPMHHASDWPWAQSRLGEARLAGSYAWRALHAAGATLAFGSDFPIESEDPRLGLRAAVLREDPAMRLDAELALQAFTRGAAYAAFAERDTGAWLSGFRADFSVFRGDPRGDPLASTAVATFLEGAPVS